MKQRNSVAISSVDVSVKPVSTYVGHGGFTNVVKRVYEYVSWLKCRYSNFHSWYWEKVVPGLIDENREIFIALANRLPPGAVDKGHGGYTNAVKDEIIGVAILKTDGNEKKISTLYVSVPFRRAGIATRLLKASFHYLETTKPSISIPEMEEENFKKIIKRYKWVKTQTINGKSMREFIYN